MSIQQNSNDADGKTFGSKAPDSSALFGSFAEQETASPGSDPGSKQAPQPVFSGAVKE